MVMKAHKLLTGVSGAWETRVRTRLGNELDQQVPTIIEMELGQVNVELEQDQDGTLRVTGIPSAACRA